MNKTITFIGNGKMAQALAKGLSEHFAIEVVGRSSQALEHFEQSIGAAVKKTLYTAPIVLSKARQFSFV